MVAEQKDIPGGTRTPNLLIRSQTPCPIGPQGRGRSATRRARVRERNAAAKKENECVAVFLFCFLVSDVTEVTRSARKYCKTGATLGQGGTQAYQAPSRGLNNPLKLL